MTLNSSTNEIQTFSGQTFTTEKFLIDKIRKRVRLLTGLQELLINQFLYEVVEDFCKKTWILRKLIQVGDILIEVDNDSDYYVASIDLTTYADDLLIHDIVEISIDGRVCPIRRSSYLGDPTGAEDNEGEILDGYNFEIVDDTTIKIWPVNLDSIILLPVIFRTSPAITITEIPHILEDYYQEIASGVILEMRGVQQLQSEDALHYQTNYKYHEMNYRYHERNYKKGISRGKYQYAKQHKGNQIQKTSFAL